MMVGSSFPWRRQQGGVGFHAAASFLLVYSLQGWGAGIPCIVDGGQHENHVLLHSPFFLSLHFIINVNRINIQ